VDPHALVTCGDVYATANARLEEMRRSGRGETRAAIRLATLLKSCPGVGSRKDSKILQALSIGGC
jgi:hypothetical protein